VTCGAHPAVASSVGNNGIRPSDLCRALAYYPAHSTESRCSYGSIIGPVVPSRVLISGTINGQVVHLNMGMHCNPPAKLAHMTGLIWTAVFGYPEGVRASISESTFTRLTEIARRQAQALGDPRVHSAELVLTTRRRMNGGLGIGYQASQDQTAKVFVIQLVGKFTCNDCKHPLGAAAPTGSAAQDVLSYGSLLETDFGITPKPVVMQRMGPVMHLTWKPTVSPHSSTGLKNGNPTPPPRFTKQPGWFTGSSNHAPSPNPNHTQTHAWASTTPFKDAPFSAPPGLTLRTIRRDDIVICIFLYRPAKNDQGGPVPSNEQRLSFPLTIDGAAPSQGYDGQPNNGPWFQEITGNAGQGRILQAWIFIGQPHPAPLQVNQANAMLAKLRIPSWATSR
jgi:hypothetical protein